jgi:hypothetical protein
MNITPQELTSPCSKNECENARENQDTNTNRKIVLVAIFASCRHTMTDCCNEATSCGLAGGRVSTHRLVFGILGRRCLDATVPPSLRRNYGFQRLLFASELLRPLVLVIRPCCMATERLVCMLSTPGIIHDNILIRKIGRFLCPMIVLYAATTPNPSGHLLLLL